LAILPFFTILLSFSAFYRVTNAVIAPDLLREFNLDPEQLGMLGSAFFYAFAIVQIPVGLLLDWIGPRKVILVSALIGAIGAFIFASAGNFYAALAGRALLGIGMSPTLLATLKVLVTTFPPKRFSTLSGIIISFATVGNILATSPLAYLNSVIGWRATLTYAGIITALLAFLIFWVLKEDIHDAHRDTSSNVSREQNEGVVEVLKRLLSNLSFWQIGSIAFCRYGTFVALQGVWLGPYLMNIKNFTPLTTGNILLMLSLGIIAGSPVAGYLARVFRTVKPVIIIGLCCYTLCLVPFTGIWKVESVFAFSAICVLLGFFSGFGSLAYAHIKELFPLSMSATAIAGVNFFVIAGGAVFMQIIGTIISLYAATNQTYHPGAYHLAFFICLMGMLGSLVFYAFSKRK
jgi:MFS family permease